jgi:uncharacterized protein YnzC (UPF0291/DUF896 family)
MYNRKEDLRKMYVSKIKKIMKRKTNTISPITKKE